MVLLLAWRADEGCELFIVLRLSLITRLRVSCSLFTRENDWSVKERTQYMMSLSVGTVMTKYPACDVIFFSITYFRLIQIFLFVSVLVRRT